MSVIAIDGPAGAGKSTVAKAVAEALGWRYLDTGAMYRIVALAALERGTSLDDPGALGALAEQLDMSVEEGRVLLEGDDVSERIRNHEVTRVASRVAAMQPVRDALVSRQRSVAERSDVVMEGRDIGSAVAPDAAVKVFLTASIEARARRRRAQLGLEADEATLRAIRVSLAERDDADARRAASPLARAKDAVVVDSTSKKIDEVVTEIVGAAERILSERGRAR